LGVSDIKAAQGVISLTIADLSARLNKPFLSSRFLGTGGLEGPAEAAQRIKRRSFGRVFDVAGEILDKANSIYEFGDPAFPLQSIVDVRDMGASATPAPTVVAWAGSVAATFAALQAQSMVGIQCAVAPSIACAKWYTEPQGPLCADLLGEVGTGYVETAPALAERILIASGGPALAAGELAAANAIRPDPAGIHVDDESMTPAQALDWLCLTVSLSWVLEAAGTVRFRPFTFAAPVETLQSVEVERVQILPPVKARRLGYRKNNRIHADSEISAGALPTLAELDPAAAAKLGGIEDEADVTSIVQVDKAQVTVPCDSSGTPDPGQFPVVIQAKLIRNGSIVTAGIAWTYRILSGGANGLNPGSAPTALAEVGTTAFQLASLESTSAVVELKATQGDRERTGTIQFDKLIPPPPTGGSSSGGNTGGTAASDSSLASINSSTMAVVSDELIVTVGSNGEVALTASISIDKSTGGPGIYPVYGVFDWWNGSAWVDVGTETNSEPDLIRNREPVEDGGSNITYTQVIGSLAIATSKTGLTAASSQKFRLKCRTAGSTQIHQLYGSVTAQG
jgi:hypothetical protein